MPKLKYIILDIGGVETPVLFAPWLSHRVVAQGLKMQGTAISAGFCEIVGDTDGTLSFKPFGSSDSLGLSPGPLDSEILNEFLQ